ALRPQARGARLLSQPVRRRRRGGGVDPAHRAGIPPADREPRRAVRRPRRRRVRRGHRRPRADPAVGAAEARAMNIGMGGYASVGGRGVAAPELAHAPPRRGHRIHVISSEPPFRWKEGAPRLSFHRVEVPPYPLFREPQYLLALTNTIAHAAEAHALDIVHAHYAVPHATAAYLALQMLD